MDRIEIDKRTAFVECIRLSGAGAKGVLLNESNMTWHDVVRVASI